MSTKMATIALDAMGGDAGPAEVVAAVKLAFESIPELKDLILLGDEAILQPLVAEADLSENKRLTIHHAPEVIGMDEKPIQSLKQKKNSSMVQGIQLIKEGKAAVLLSTGNTGSLMAGGTIKLRTLPGVERPALATVWPSQNRHFILLDAGANPESKPEHLVQNAILGSHYARVLLGLREPRVGLLTIGTEEGKGTELINTAHPMLKAIGNLINYQGPIEGFNVFDGKVDVIVCDGFTGNILLKTCESLFHLLKRFLSEELNKNYIRKFGAFLALPAFKAMKQQLNPDQYGGAPLLGLNGHVLKAHGASNRVALKNAIQIGLDIVKHDMNDQILHDIEAANSILKSHSTDAS
tara:strand:- start:147 stop:1202 length:1056 start_codon:yes stop_codon:yes gene_type:complete